MPRVVFRVTLAGELQDGFLVRIGSAAYGAASSIGIPVHYIQAGTYSHTLERSGENYKTGTITITPDETVTQTYTFELVEAPPSLTPPAISNPPIEDRPNPQPGGYWRVGMASPNDSTSRFLGAKFGSYADCVRSWQGAGNGGDGGCTFEAPPAAPPTESPLGKWVKDTVSGLGDFAGKLSERLSALSDAVQRGFASLQRAITGLESKIQQEGEARKKDITGIWDKLEGWLIERLVGLMLRALDKEEE